MTGCRERRDISGSSTWDTLASVLKNETLLQSPGEVFSVHVNMFLCLSGFLHYRVTVWPGGLMLTTLSEPEQSDCEWTELKMNKAAAEVENRSKAIVLRDA